MKAPFPFGAFGALIKHNKSNGLTEDIDHAAPQSMAGGSPAHHSQ
jgi:hypothetical protein